MSHREIMQWDAGKAHVLDAPERERDMPAAKVIELLSVDGSETVIDYGAGTGRLALAAAHRMAPRGRVIAIEDSSEMFHLLSERLAGIACAEPMLIEGDDVPLPDKTADRILAVDVLHHIRPGTLAEMRRLLAPDGVLLMIDWNAVTPARAVLPTACYSPPPKRYASSPHPAWKRISSSLRSTTATS